MSISSVMLFIDNISILSKHYYFMVELQCLCQEEKAMRQCDKIRNEIIRATITWITLIFIYVCYELFFIFIKSYTSILIKYFVFSIFFIPLNI